MGKVCSRCNKSLSRFADYGTKEIRLCYDCAQDLKCSTCGTSVEINSQHYHDLKMFCASCNDNYLNIAKARLENEIDKYQTGLIQKKIDDDSRLRKLTTSSHIVRGLNQMLDWFSIFVLAVLILIIFYWDSSINALSFRLIVLVSYFFYYLLFEYFAQRTPAKFLTGSIVTDTFGKKPTFKAIFIRTVCRFIPFEMVTFLGEDCIGIHDRLSGTRVIDKRDYIN